MSSDNTVTKSDGSPSPADNFSPVETISYMKEVGPYLRDMVDDNLLGRIKSGSFVVSRTLDYIDSDVSTQLTMIVMCIITLVYAFFARILWALWRSVVYAYDFCADSVYAISISEIPSHVVSMSEKSSSKTLRLERNLEPGEQVRIIPSCKSARILGPSKVRVDLKDVHRSIRIASVEEGGDATYIERKSVSI